MLCHEYSGSNISFSPSLCTFTWQLCAFQLRELLARNDNERVIFNEMDALRGGIQRGSSPDEPSKPGSQASTLASCPITWEEIEQPMQAQPILHHARAAGLQVLQAIDSRVCRSMIIAIRFHCVVEEIGT